ncbi:hypothetical protein ACLOJK_029322 [Asimina triloba]
MPATEAKSNPTCRPQKFASPKITPSAHVTTVLCSSARSALEKIMWLALISKRVSCLSTPKVEPLLLSSKHKIHPTGSATVARPAIEITDVSPPTHIVAAYQPTSEAISFQRHSPIMVLQSHLRLHWIDTHRATPVVIPMTPSLSARLPLLLSPH